MALVCDKSCRRCDAQRFVERLHYSNGYKGKRMVDRCRLADHIMRRWHGLAAVLTVMPMPHALHQLAALHSLLSSCHRSAIEGVGTESNYEHSRED